MVEWNDRWMITAGWEDGWIFGVWTVEGREAGCVHGGSW
jgi:hypothetical protein